MESKQMECASPTMKLQADMQDNLKSMMKVVGTSEQKQQSETFGDEEAIRKSFADTRATSYNGIWNPFVLFQQSCKRAPERMAMIWVDGDGKEQDTVTYGEFLERVRQCAKYLKIDQALKRGERVMLCYPPGLEFYVAFWACLAEGIIAVPVCPADPFNRKSDVGEKIASIMQDCSPKIVLTSQMYHDALTTAKFMDGDSDANGFQDHLDPFDFSRVRWLPTDRTKIPEVEKDEYEFSEPQEAPETIAFLQYTSGSTGAPKGVMVGYKSLVTNARIMGQMCHGLDNHETFTKSVGISWLPSFHDMGLIGFHVVPIFGGGHCVYLSPLDFVADPCLWLKVVHRYSKRFGPVISGVPPFALDLCVSKTKPELLSALDLSGLSVLFLGAEPILDSSLQAFKKKFEPAGFSENCFTPAYGLAENVLAASGKLSNRYPPVRCYFSEEELQHGRLVEMKSDEPNGRWLVSSGEGLTTYKENLKLLYVKPEDVDAPEERFEAGANSVVVVNPETGVECEDGMVGELWIAGASKTHGYWNNADKTRESFKAKLTNTVTTRGEAVSDQEFLRSGDYGAYNKTGALFVTGRLKDMIILHGTNFYPHDIEESVKGCHVAIRPGSVAAIPVPINDNKKEGLCVLVELHDPNRKKGPNRHQPSKASQLGYSIVNHIAHIPARMASAVSMEGSVLPPGPITLGTKLRLGSQYYIFKAASTVRNAVVRCRSRRRSQPVSADAPEKKPKSVTEEKKVKKSAEAERMIATYSEEKLENIGKAIRKTVMQRFGVPVSAVILLAPRVVLKTSSGKVRRSTCRLRLLKGELQAVSMYQWHGPGVSLSSWRTAASANTTSTDEKKEESVDLKELDIELVKRRLVIMMIDECSDRDDIDLEPLYASGDIYTKQLDELGVDSLTATRISKRITKEFALHTPLSVFMFMHDPTLNGVAKVIAKMSSQAPPAPHPKKVIDMNYKPASGRRDGGDAVPFILGIGTHVPGPGMDQKEICKRMLANLELGDKRKASFKKIGETCKINRRHSVLPSVEAIYFGKKGLGNDEGIEPRNKVFVREAPILSIQAAMKAIKDWGGDKRDITHVVAVTCTGVIVPGLEFQILHGLGLSDDTQRLGIVFMGCFGALSGLKCGKALACESPKNRVLVVCTELCSLHMQLNDEVDNLIASVLFADGSGSMVLGTDLRKGETPLYEVHRSTSYIIPNTTDMMSWDLSATGMIIGLSKAIPAQIYEHIGVFADILLAGGAAKDEKRGKEQEMKEYQKPIDRRDCVWAIHPGGPMIIQSIIDALQIPEESAQAAWDVMANNGNMSSASLIFVLDNIRKNHAGCEWVPSLAFGPGLNVEGALLRKVPSTVEEADAEGFDFADAPSGV